MYLDTTDVVPAPKLVPALIIKNSSGMTKPTPASWSAPNPATQIESMMLYNEIIIIDSINGIDNFFTASFGFSLSKLTPCVSSFVFINNNSLFKIIKKCLIFELSKKSF